MTEEQLQALIDQEINDNGNGAITGPLLNSVLKSIITVIFDQVGGEAAVPDSRSIKHNAGKQLAVMLPTWEPLPGSKRVKAIAFDTASEVAGGVYIKTDGKTVFGNGAGELTTVNSGVLPDVTVVSDDFTTQPTGAAMNKAYLSVDSKNGYLKLDTGAAVDTAYFVKKDIAVTMDGNAKFDVLFALGSLTNEKATVGLSTIDADLPDVAGIKFIFDPAVDAYWHLIASDGGEITINLATLVAADTNEHLFEARVEDGKITWYIDGAEVGTTGAVNLTDTELNFGVWVESTAAESKTAVIDFYNLGGDRVDEEVVTYSAQQAVSAPLKHAGFWSQAGANAPTVSVLENSLGTIAIARTAAGTYTITKVGAFKEGKTVPLDDIWTDASGNVYTLVWTSADVMTLTTKTSAGALADDILDNRFIFIEIYQ
ncbi:MAG TPA: hypothetical protein PKH58_01430 [Paludibacteraceae bacterium]|mgnify:CR=1 FL=1|nr:hypothetical protein [Paludibacteraceae bacterium]